MGRIAELESAIQRIFAVVCIGELAQYPFMSPDFVPGALRTPDKKLVPLLKYRSIASFAACADG
jgi:hypothetical protein